MFKSSKPSFQFKWIIKRCIHHPSLIPKNSTTKGFNLFHPTDLKKYPTTHVSLLPLSSTLSTLSTPLSKTKSPSLLNTTTQSLSLYSSSFFVHPSHFFSSLIHASSTTTSLQPSKLIPSSSSSSLTPPTPTSTSISNPSSMFTPSLFASLPGPWYVLLELRGYVHLVTQHDILMVHKLDLPLGTILQLDKVRELGTKEFTLRGHPFVHQANVKAMVIEHFKTKKRWTIKKKKRKGYQRKIGHREQMTTLRILCVNASSTSPTSSSSSSSSSYRDENESQPMESEMENQDQQHSKNVHENEQPVLQQSTLS